MKAASIIWQPASIFILTTVAAFLLTRSDETHTITISKALRAEIENDATKRGVDKRIAVEKYVEDEVHFREGIKNGLHLGDSIVRQQVVKRSRFIHDALLSDKKTLFAAAPQPTAKTDIYYDVEHLVFGNKEAAQVAMRQENDAAMTSLAEPSGVARILTGLDRQLLSKHFGTEAEKFVTAQRECSAFCGPVPHDGRWLLLRFNQSQPVNSSERNSTSPEYGNGQKQRRRNNTRGHKADIARNYRVVYE